MNGEYITPTENSPTTLSPEKEKKARENVTEGLNLLKQQGTSDQCDDMALSGVEGEFKPPPPIEEPKKTKEPLKPMDPSEGKEDRTIPNDGTPYLPPEKDKIPEP